MIDLYGAIEPFRVVLDGEEFSQNPLKFVQNDNWFGTSRVAIMGNNIQEMNIIAVMLPSWFTMTKLEFQVWPLSNYFEFIAVILYLPVYMGVGSGGQCLG